MSFLKYARNKSLRVQYEALTSMYVTLIKYHVSLLFILKSNISLDLSLRSLYLSSIFNDYLTRILLDSMCIFFLKLFIFFYFRVWLSVKKVYGVSTVAGEGDSFLNEGWSVMDEHSTTFLLSFHSTQEYQDKASW